MLDFTNALAFCSPLLHLVLQSRAEAELLTGVLCQSCKARLLTLAGGNFGLEVVLLRFEGHKAVQWLAAGGDSSALCEQSG